MALDGIVSCRSLGPTRKQLKEATVKCRCLCSVLFHFLVMLASPSLHAPDHAGSACCQGKPSASRSVPLRPLSLSSMNQSGQSPMPLQTTSSLRSKQKIVFQLAHPPPVVKHKQRLHIRPKLLLQLHETSLASRPVPTLDVLPSTLFATRLARRFPKIFRGKSGLGPDDLIIARSPEYSAHHNELEAVEDDALDKREVIAAISHPRKIVPGHGELDEINFNDGSRWQALQMPSGIYEFTLYHDSTNLVARWVPRHSVARRQSLRAHGRAAAALPRDERFTFSLINPTSRRHPVIASMTRQSIDVPWEYNDPWCPPSSELHPFYQDHAVTEQAPPTTNHVKPMTDELKTLILVSGIWVAFREGFSPNFKYDSLGPSPPSSPPANGRGSSPGLTHTETGREPHPHHIRNLSDGRPPLRHSINGRFSVPSTPTYSSLASVPSRRAVSIGTSSPPFVPYHRTHMMSSATGHFGNGIGPGSQLETCTEEDDDHTRRPSTFSSRSSNRQSSSSYDQRSVTKVGRFKRMLGLGRRSGQEPL